MCSRACLLAACLATAVAFGLEKDSWRPVSGRGDPMKNDPTFDYLPPALESVHYWGIPMDLMPPPPPPPRMKIPISMTLDPPPGPPATVSMSLGTLRPLTSVAMSLGTPSQATSAAVSVVPAPLLLEYSTTVTLPPATTPPAPPQTTPAPALEDYLLEPAKPAPGRLYVIIEGHSRVRTYRPQPSFSGLSPDENTIET